MGNSYPSVPSYQSPEWRALRKAYLAAHPWCVYCLKLGIFTHARIVDHIVPHRGDYALWKDEKNLQGLCKPHGNGTKSKEELTGQQQGCSLSGWPTSPTHFWNGGPKDAAPVKSTQQIGAEKKLQAGTITSTTRKENKP